MTFFKFSPKIKFVRKSNEGKKNEQKNQKWTAVTLAWDLGFIVAIPLLVFALLGRIADKKFGTGPWFFLAGIIIALISSSILAYLKTKDIINS